MPGRSLNAIKNRFHATKRKLERHNKRDGSNLNPDAGGGEVVSAPKQAGRRRRRGQSQGRDETKPAQAMSHETYKEEQMAGGTALADTPTSPIARERRNADAHFDRANAELDIQDRLGMEANGGARRRRGRDESRRGRGDDDGGGQLSEEVARGATYLTPDVKYARSQFLDS